MYAKLALAAATIAFASACASTAPATTAANGATASKATYYCWKERLYAEGDGYSCNWETDIASACTSTGVRTLKKNAIAGAPRAAGMCKTGEWLVTVSAG